MPLPQVLGPLNQATTTGHLQMRKGEHLIHKDPVASMSHCLRIVLEIRRKTFQQWKGPTIPGKAASQPFGRKEGSSSSAFSLDLVNFNMDTTLQP